MPRISLLALCFALATPAARPDILFLKNGGKVRGRVTERGDKYYVGLKVGRIAVAKSDVARVQWDKEVRAEYQKRLASIPANDAAAHYKLGCWLRGKEWTREAKAEFEKALQIDPNYAPAHKALHHVFLKDKWYSEDEAMRLMGYVKVRGKWIRRRDLEKLEKGLECLAAVRAAQRKIEDAVGMMFSPSRARRQEGKKRLLALSLEYKCPELAAMAIELSHITAGRRSPHSITIIQQTSQPTMRPFTITTTVDGRPRRVRVLVPMQRRFSIGVRK